MTDKDAVKEMIIDIDRSVTQKPGRDGKKDSKTLNNDFELSLTPYKELEHIGKHFRWELEEIDQKEKDDELLNTAEESFNTEQANSVGGDRENDSFGSSPGMDDEIEQVVVGLDNKKRAVLARLKKKL